MNRGDDIHEGKIINNQLLIIKCEVSAYEGQGFEYNKVSRKSSINDYKWSILN